MTGPYLTIGLCGREGVGKDTVAGILHALVGFHRTAFADPLREEVSAAFGVDPRVFTDRDQKSKPDIVLAIGRCADGDFIRTMHALGCEIGTPRSPRDIMRWWGTEYRRSKCGSDYWLRLMEDHLDTVRRNGTRKIVITDVRFPNEARLVRAHGGQIWRVYRPMADKAKAEHISEMQLDDFAPDVTINNNSTLDQLVHEVSSAYMDAVEAA
ncbi:hypothetical protein FOZ76_14620 [Verticiella sediminum]|uniref:Deoxynucleotide monophosphate kinase n=1 Tax=Verticiella sediminum TaxID=1247510 RepID=A0A556AID8_9BURK|nr:hypothetical protein [Verticiella sediminum]TSH92651.1 hypothetical protein FOZ76_14620 [Verticiella sediminum]